MDSGGSQNFIVSYRLLSLVGALCTLAAITALIFVSAIRGVDALSTVALALAILAFVIQILFFIAQSATAAEQAKQMMELNADSRTLLEGVRSNVDQIKDLLREHFSYVLQKALDGRTPEEQAEPREGEVDPLHPDWRPDPRVEFVDRPRDDPLFPPGPLSSELYRLLRPRLSYSPHIGPYPPDDRDLEIVRILDGFPDEEKGLELFNEISSLSPLEIAEMTRFVENEREARKRGIRGYLMGDDDRGETLRARGLLEEVPRHPDVMIPGSGSVRVGLTSRGIEAGSLLIGIDRPEWLRTANDARSSDSSKGDSRAD